MTPDPRIPPEYEGRTWPYRVLEYVGGEPVERTIASPFPPVMVGVPGEITEAFIDFQRWHGLRVRREHPDYYCVDCRIRFTAPICTHRDCKSARTEPTGAPRAEDGTPHRCLTCGRPFPALLLCGPCIGRREEAGQLRATAQRSADPVPRPSAPARRPATPHGRRR